MTAANSASAKNPRVIAVVLMWNSYPDAADCIESLRRSTYPLGEMLVVDNGSTDGSADRVAAAHPDVRLLRIVPNAGYAKGANLGLAEAIRRGADWILFLATDTAIAPDLVARLVGTVTASPEIGIIGPRIMHHDDPGTLQHGAGYIDGHGWAVHRAKTTTTECDWVTGCGFMVSARALQALPEPKGFDERFFAYWEDVDLSHRIARIGLRVVYEPAAELLHKESVMTRAAESLTKKRSRQYYTLRNQYLFARRHLSRGRLIGRAARGLFVEMPQVVGSWIRRQGLGPDALLLVRAYLDGIRGRDGRAQYPGLY